MIEAFETDEAVARASDEEAAAREEASVPEAPHKRGGRRPLLGEDAKVEEEMIRMEPEGKTCPECGAPLAEIRTDRSEEIDFVPARFIRRIYERPILACPHCQGHVAQAAMPARPIDGGRPGAGLLAQIAVSRFCDHQPYYRQERIFARHGLNVSRAAMNRWMGNVADRLEPLAKIQRKLVVESGYVQIDETPVALLDPNVKGKSRKAWLWALHSPSSGEWFHFSEGRGAKDIRGELKGLRGIAQTDGYAVYETLFAEMNRAAAVKAAVAGTSGAPPLIEHAGCWAHARRKFWESGKLEESAKAGEVVALIQQLYRIEKRLHGSPPETVAATRGIESVPVLGKIRALLEGYRDDPSVLPNSRFGEAVRYTLARWDALTLFTRHGVVQIDDNPVERGIRPAALGRKNRLFIGHPAAGWRVGVFYTMMANCALAKVNPWNWLRDVLQRIPSMTT